MKIFALASILFAAACGTSSTTCETNACVCAAGESCSYTCAPGSACDVQCAPGEPCDVTCDASQVCHVECSGATSCKVDCNGGPECHVTAPATNATVTDCPAGSCVVACGEVGEATRSGTTATCP